MELEQTATQVVNAPVLTNGKRVTTPSGINPEIKATLLNMALPNTQTRNNKANLVFYLDHAGTSNYDLKTKKIPQTS
jgi:hypothetical protein